MIVPDLDEARAAPAEEGAGITTEEATSATGRFLYACHRGGVEAEYVEWTPQVRCQVLGA
ncbi:hypothetical protein [Streptomyces sp. CRN 30]|uniref:hypothetical protein n=1 Tax=Streptomyces sp. CRN 30 TaxID=3075613 RepID=UPI002A7F8C4B|nr:hypothetical protein [Streptomyces sp. CRN 30]